MKEERAKTKSALTKVGKWGEIELELNQQFIEVPSSKIRSKSNLPAINRFE